MIFERGMFVFQMSMCLPNGFHASAHDLDAFRSDFITAFETILEAPEPIFTEFTCMEDVGTNNDVLFQIMAICAVAESFDVSPDALVRHEQALQVALCDAFDCLYIAVNHFALRYIPGIAVNRRLRHMVSQPVA